jgi:hypothetical protein
MLESHGMDLLMRSMGDLFIPHPLAALLPAAVFFAAAILLKGRVASAVAAIWVLYAFYELLMKARILCSGDCNIRIDLLAIYPALVLVTVAGVVVSAVSAKRLLQRRHSH